MTATMKRWIIFTFFCFGIIILAVVVGMNIKSNADAKDLLIESVETHLLSVATTAEDIINAYDFSKYNSKEDILADSYYAVVLRDLRELAASSGAKYIYALKEIDGEFIFIFDIDLVDNAVFQPYELSPVHLDAFRGIASAGVMNNVDEYGSFNTGAVPIFLDNQVIVIVAVDIEDNFIAESIRQSRVNTITLIAVLMVLMTAIGIILLRLLKKLEKAQAELERMANYDKLTNLPNRRYLLDYLAEISHRKSKSAYALYFIDMDNFKQVNDNAGHDAGDELLQHMALYLQTAQAGRVFRPGAGSLNVAARIGGDEFVLIVDSVRGREEAEAYAAELISGFKQDSIDKYIEKYNVGLSIGVALFPEHAENFHVLIKYADIAMYQAKRSGKNCYRMYEIGMGGTEEHY